MELILLSAVFLALLWTAWRVGYWHGQRSLTRIDDHAKRRRLRLGLPDPTVEPDEPKPLVWPGHCSHGDTYDHGPVLLPEYQLPGHRDSGEVAP